MTNLDKFSGWPSVALIEFEIGTILNKKLLHSYIPPAVLVSTFSHPITGFKLLPISFLIIHYRDTSIRKKNPSKFSRTSTKRQNNLSFKVWKQICIYTHTVEFHFCCFCVSASQYTENKSHTAHNYLPSCGEGGGRGTRVSIELGKDKSGTDTKSPSSFLPALPYASLSSFPLKCRRMFHCCLCNQTFI